MAFCITTLLLAGISGNYPFVQANHHIPGDRKWHVRPHNLQRPPYEGYDWYHHYPRKDIFQPDEDFEQGLDTANALARTLLNSRLLRFGMLAGKTITIEESALQKNLNHLETIARLFILDEINAKRNSNESTWNDNMQRSLDLAEIWAQNVLERNKTLGLPPEHVAPMPKTSEELTDGLDHLERMLLSFPSPRLMWR